MKQKEDFTLLYRCIEEIFINKNKYYIPNINKNNFNGKSMDDLQIDFYSFLYSEEREKNVDDKFYFSIEYTGDQFIKIKQKTENIFTSKNTKCKSTKDLKEYIKKCVNIGNEDEKKSDAKGEKRESYNDNKTFEKPSQSMIIRGELQKLRNEFNSLINEMNIKLQEEINSRKLLESEMNKKLQKEISALNLLEKEINVLKNENTKKNNENKKMDEKYKELLKESKSNNINEILLREISEFLVESYNIKIIGDGLAHPILDINHLLKMMNGFENVKKCINQIRPE